LLRPHLSDADFRTHLEKAFICDALVEAHGHFEALDLFVEAEALCPSDPKVGPVEVKEGTTLLELLDARRSTIATSATFFTFGEKFDVGWSGGRWVYGFVGPRCPPHQELEINRGLELRWQTRLTQLAGVAFSEILEPVGSPPEK
jgi:hypothetical protein